MNAYNIKKIAPRILIGIVMLNLSIYLVVAAADVTRIIANGVGDLITTPIKDSNNFTVGSNTSLTTGPAVPILIGGYFLQKAVRKHHTAGTTATASSQDLEGTAGALTADVNPADNPGGRPGTNELVQWLLLFVLLPVALTVISIFVTLVLRQGLLVFLAITAPIACVLYILPSTEKYFKKWWDLFLRTLMVYPIIVLIFAVSSFLASIIFQINEGSLSSLIAGIITMFAPMAMIPFAFKFAGGAIASIYGTFAGGGKRFHEAVKGNANDPNSLRNRVKRNAGANIIRRRANFIRNNQRGAPGTSFGVNQWRKGAARVVGMGDVMSREAAINAEGIKRMQQVKDTGDDTYGRAATSIPLYFDKVSKLFTTEEVDASGERNARAIDKKGNLLRRSMGGKTYTDEEYKKGRELYRTNGELQAWGDYEATKVGVGDTEAYKSNFLKWADQEGLSDSETQGLYIGIAFARQNERLNLKYSAIKRDDDTGKRVFADVNDPTMNFNAKTGELGKNDEMVNDIYYKKGPYVTGNLSEEDMNRVFDIEGHVASNVRTLGSVDPASLPDDRAREQHRATLENARKRLEQIQSLKKTWKGTKVQPGGPTPVQQPGAQPTPGGTPDQLQGYSGLAGANQGVQDAFNRRLHTANGDEIWYNPNTGQQQNTPPTIIPGT